MVSCSRFLHVFLAFLGIVVDVWALGRISASKVEGFSYSRCSSVVDVWALGRISASKVPQPLCYLEGNHAHAYFV